ncbi:MAG: acetyl-CoA carboxylase biotin carboxylase subunit [Alphaproteobacteria bacterium]
MFKKILIANRGEIACRVMRTARRMGIKTVAVYSEADADALHVQMADEAVAIGPAPSQQSYLSIEKIIAACKATGAEAVHPGYGFLSENAKFAEIVEEHGLTFIGPSPDHIRMMGDKVEAKKAMRSLKVPCVPGTEDAVTDPELARTIAAEIGYPVLIKAAGGGGGKGMKVASQASELAEMMTLAKREALANFGNDAIYMEKYLSHPRHIELQILADTHGNVVHLGERDCSLQRKHQKVLEEAPSPALNAKERKRLGDIGCDAIKQLGYRNAGTLEFLYQDGEFYFIEMNTRLQVEHPITEAISDIDIVREMIRIASGAPLSFKQEDVVFFGHAIECRINAENPTTFKPSPGTVTDYHSPGGLGVRVDSALYAGYRVPPHYDSLVAKLIVHASTRNECLMRLRRSLEEFVIGGIETTIPLHARLVSDPDFINGDYDIRWLERFVAKGT